MADFIIIGGGVYGCGVAWELAKRGADVCLLEAETVASGASGGLGKRGVRANDRDLRELPLMARAYDIWPGLATELDAPTGYDRTGHLMLVERELDLRRAEAVAWMQTKQGIPSILLGQGELKDKEPLVSDRVIGALYCPKDGVADHTATTKGYANAAVKLGVELREQNPVVGLEKKGGRVVGVITAQGDTVRARKGVLLVSNSHSKPFVQQEFGFPLPVWSRYPQVMVSEPLASPIIHHLIGHARRKLAIKAVAGGRIMISGGWDGRLNPETGQGETIPAQVEGNRAEAVVVFPSLAEVPIEETAADRLELISVDGIPIIDYLPGADNLLLATGWSGHGWAIAPAVCQMLADWLLTGHQPELLRPFGFRRFG